MPFLSGADLLVLHDLSEALIILGLVGVASMLFNERRIQRRWLGLSFALMAAGGVALAWRIDQLQIADRDLTGAQQFALSRAVSPFSGVQFVVQTLPDDKEAHSLARKIADAIKAGIGEAPEFMDTMSPLPLGVVLVFASKDADLRRDFAGAVGTQLAAARIAVIAEEDPQQPEHTVRIIVGRNP